MSIPSRMNRIDYILSHQPAAVTALNKSWGQDSTEQSLARQTKALVRDKGKAYIEALLMLHPDKSAILAAAGHDDAWDGFCGCGGTTSSFDGEGDSQSLLKDIVAIVRDEYQDSALLRKIKTYSSQQPAADTALEEDQLSPKGVTIPTTWLWVGGSFCLGLFLAGILKGGHA